MTTHMVPPSRPALPQAKVAQILIERGVRNPVAILGWRGYYLDSLGEPGRNERGIYDDALFVCSCNAFAAFNANTDPSVFRPGVAVLEPGVWQYKLGIHGLSKPVASRYEALVQADEVTVRRDRRGLDTGFFGINIHRGSTSTTSSLGCQTIHPGQWAAFIALVKGEMQRLKQTQVPYLLINDPRIRGGA